MTHRFLKLFCTLLFAVWASASSAMFISPDPLDPTTPGVGTNRYAYSGGDPINRADPSGHAWVDRTWDSAFGEGSFDRTFGDGASERMDRTADSLFGDSHDRAAASAYGDYSRGGGSLGYNAWRAENAAYTGSFINDYMAGRPESGLVSPNAGPGAASPTMLVGGALDSRTRIVRNLAPPLGAQYYTWGQGHKLRRDVFSCSMSSSCSSPTVIGHSLGGETAARVAQSLSGRGGPMVGTLVTVDAVNLFGGRSPISGSSASRWTNIQARPSRLGLSDYVGLAGASYGARAARYGNAHVNIVTPFNHGSFGGMLGYSGLY